MLDLEQFRQKNIEITSMIRGLRHPGTSLETHYRHRKIKHFALGLDEFHQPSELDWLSAAVMQDIDIPRQLRFPVAQLSFSLPERGDDQTAQEYWKRLMRTTDGVDIDSNYYYFNSSGQALKLVSVTEFEPTGDTAAGEDLYDTITLKGSGRSHFAPLTERDYGRAGALLQAVQDGDFMTYDAAMRKYVVFDKTTNGFIPID